jgi:hypothetical protein
MKKRREEVRIASGRGRLKKGTAAVCAAARCSAGGPCAVDLGGMREVGPATRQAAKARDLGSYSRASGSCSRASGRCVPLHVT